jgi:uncharacterized protein (DUF433 family)
MSPGKGKAAPFSIRLERQDDDYVQSEARRLNRPRGAVVQGFTSEAIRMRRFPGIAFRGDDHRRRAWVIGTGLDIWELVALVRDFGSEQELAQEYDLTPGQIRIALAYYNEYRDEVEEQLTRGRPPLEQLSSRYPFIQSFEAATPDVGS